MATKSLVTRIVLRNDTSANWSTAKDVVLLKGEPAIVFFDDGSFRIKMGDGATKFESLPYYSVSENVFQVSVDKGADHIAAITTAVGSTVLVKGDTAIVKENLIAGDSSKVVYTGYVYNGTAWAAMDGNVRAENVYFSTDTVYTKPIGVLTVPSSGQGVYASTGKNLVQYMDGIMSKEENPTKTDPAVSLSVTGLGSVEIGTKVDLKYTASLSAGSYTYGPATGITAKSWSVSCTGVTEKETTASGTFSQVQATETAKTITAIATYGNGAMPVTNKGNAYSAAQIKAGSATKTSGSLTGVRHMYWGTMTTDAAITSATVRALAKHEAVANKTLANYTAGASAKKVVVAVPSGKKVSKVLLTTSMNADITSQFVKQSATVSVEGANGYTAAAYNIFVYQPASIDAAETYAITIANA